MGGFTRSRRKLRTASAPASTIAVDTRIAYPAVESFMKPYAIAQRPWTCRFGRTGVTIEELDAVRSRVDDVFWACRRTGRIPPLKITTRAECAECPFWEPAPNPRGERQVG
jgi:hypothetical protein